MPVPPNVETFLPQLLADYANSRREDFDLPSSEALPFVVGPTKEEQIYPRVMFVTSATSSPHPKRINLTVSAELQTSSEGQNIEQENAWTAALRHILCDVSSFATWLQSRPEGSRMGYRMYKFALATDAATMGMDDSGALRARRTDVIIHLRTDELAP